MIQTVLDNERRGTGRKEGRGEWKNEKVVIKNKKIKSGSRKKTQEKNHYESCILKTRRIMKNELESYFHLRFSLLPLTENLKSLRSGKRISIHFLELSSFVFWEISKWKIANQVLFSSSSAFSFCKQCINLVFNFMYFLLEYLRYNGDGAKPSL